MIITEPFVAWLISQRSFRRFLSFRICDSHGHLDRGAAILDCSGSGIFVLRADDDENRDFRRVICKAIQVGLVCYLATNVSKLSAVG